MIQPPNNGPFQPPAGPRVPHAFRGNCTCGRWLVVHEAFTPKNPLLCECTRRWYLDGDEAKVVPLITKPALCLDLDGTVRGSKSGARFGPDKAGDVMLLPNVEARVWQAKSEGFYVVGISNQGVVGFGTKTELEVESIVEATRRAFEAGDPFDDIRTCYALTPDAGGKVAPHARASLFRKPRYGMLVEAELRALEKGVAIAWELSLMVGDRLEDEACAQAAGIRFSWAHAFFGWPAPGGERAS